jgi:hypothetical protein
MRSLLLLLLLAPGCKREHLPARAPDAAAPAAPTKRELDGIPFRHYASAADAVRAVLLEAQPRVLGLGEVHQKTSSAAGVPSAVRRFGEQILPALGARASDLIVETWIAEGSCGAEEKRVVKSVEKVTERPAATEDEVVAVLKRAKGLGVEPHILSVSCADYRLLLAAGKVDYERLLGMITRHLRGKAERVLAARARRGADARVRTGPREVVALYGGALHNDLYPVEGLEDFSYAAALDEKSGGRYVELDLYVPEFIADDKSLAKEPWFAVFKRHGGARHLLIERGERSYILIFPRTVTGAGRAP